MKLTRHRFTRMSTLGRVVVPAAMLLVATSCGSGDSGESADTTDAADTTEAAVETTAAATTATETPGDAGGGLDVSLFADGALVGDPETVDCTLSGGEESSCYELTIAGYPADYDVGPFCPSTIEDSAEEGGVWFDGEDIYDLDGQFFVDLPELYGDDNWQLYDDEGNVFVTDTEEAFDGAARPDVEEQYQNHCVEGRLEWLDDGEPVEQTVQIPVEPVAADGVTRSRGNSGITLQGVVIAEAAPVDAILGAYTIASFDDCGGHFNPVEGYHLHGELGCSSVGGATEGDTAMFGYAMDGFAVFSPFEEGEEPDDLDECNG
ncbi:MAG: YHYH protein, partial [Microthrixaceae bacterium]|nr:YHYH protein [Microthrixaceae bacterium]